MVAMPTEANWQVTFPGNLRCSNATQIVKGMVAYGAAAAAEIDQITRRLKARSGEPNLDTLWMEEWSREADRVAKLGDEADAEGHSITAGNQYMRAGNYYYSAERFIPPGEEKLAMYRKALRCYQGAMQRLHPDIERVEVPYEDQALPAWFVKGKGLGKRPTVVLFDGMDNAKEMSVIFAGLDLARRGYEAAGIPAYNYVTSRPEVDPKRVAVMGYSFGGYHGPRICAFDKRYAACVCFGAMHWNIHDFVKGHAPTDPRQTSGSTFQWRWVVGAPDVETALEWSKKFTLEGVADKVTCPILILHGENDRVVPLEEAKKLYERVGSKNKTLRIFTEAEGGAEHCQVDNRQLGVDFIGDWLLKNM
jgi:hypothetical protein